MTALASAIVVAAVPAASHAQEGRSLDAATTVAPGRCLEKQRLVARTVEWLDGSMIESHVSAAVEETPNGVHMVIRRADEVVGERTLELARSGCDDVLEATALALASALDGKLVAPVTEVGLPPARVREPAAPLRVAPGAGRVSTAPQRARRASLGPAVTLAVDVGMLASVVPQTSMGFEPALELTLQPWFDLRAAALISTTINVTLENEEKRPRGDADVGLVAGRLDACFARSLGQRPRLRGCGGLVAGAVDTDKGFDRVDAASAPWVAASLRADLRFDAAEGFGIGFAAEGFVPVVRPDFVVAPGSELAVASFPVAGLALFAGPSYRF